MERREIIRVNPATKLISKNLTKRIASFGLFSRKQSVAPKMH